MRKSMSVYRRINQEMLAKGFDTYLLSEKTKIPYQTLRRCMRGDSSFTLDDAIRIHKYIGEHLTIEELFERSEANDLP